MGWTLGAAEDRPMQFKFDEAQYLPISVVFLKGECGGCSSSLNFKITKAVSKHLHAALKCDENYTISLFLPMRFAPVFWIGFFTVIQSVFLIGLESAEGYPLPVNDIPQAREIPQNTPYHDVFMGTLPSSRRGNTSPFSVGCPRLDGRETNLLGLRNLPEVVRGLVLFESRSIIA
ncbi:hypothetical protein TNCV_2599701 [Trichonephila clavipes]|nr:hypothetical protein TNCV_2599701 [Trichonephila clavipes]